MLIEESSADASAAEDAAFAKSFAVDRGQQVEAEAVVDPMVESTSETQAVAVEPAAEEVAVEPAGEEVAEGDQIAPVEQPRLIAGLTEDQIAAALARTSQLQSTIDKLGGRLGNLMQQVETLKAAPKTAAEQRAFDLKLEKLGATFPELAEILRQDLQPLSVPAQPVEPAPESFTREQVEQLLSEKLTSFQQQQSVAMEVKALGAAHPNWEQEIRTPQFALWRDNVIPYGKELMESEDAAFISRGLTEFKAWLASTSAPAKAQAVAQPQAQAQAQPVQASRAQQRLAQAVLPTGSAAPVAAAVSEELAFEQAFNAARGR